MRKNLIEIKKADKVIFVGDTHGDILTSKKIIKNYLKPKNKIVFLGDYVDRGPFSKENIDFLIKIKKENPKQIFLLKGNHELYPFFRFSPANFWETLSKKDFIKYSKIFEKFPLISIVKNIIAVHGILPDIKTLSDIEKIKPNSKESFQICWGDFQDKESEYLGLDPFSGRPQFGKNYFLKVMKQFKKDILIRSHQPNSPLFMFDNRCLTIFSSRFYGKTPKIAIYDFKKNIKTAKELKIIKI